MTVHGVCLSEHVHIMSKWHSTMNLATECAKKMSAFGYLKLGQKLMIVPQIFASI